MSDQSGAVQSAVYTALDGNITRAGSPVPIYDHVPEGTAKPYVVIERQVAASADFLNHRKDDRLLYLSVWSVYEGQDEVTDIMAQIEVLLADQRFALSTGSLIRCQVHGTETVRDLDGVTYMGQVRLRLMTAR